MTDPVLALETLFEDVRARFADEAPDVQVLFGWRERGKQTNQSVALRANRVVFAPGVEGKAGSYVGARAPGRNPRPLRTLLETCSIYVWGYDAVEPRSEVAQWRATRLLHDAVVRACELSMRSNVHANLTINAWSDPEWLLPDIEHTFGAELRITLTLESEIPDSPYLETAFYPPGDAPTAAVPRPMVDVLLNEESDGTLVVPVNP